jgi:succinate-semialdehyde dehydrogenase / glutarate-semialdehyde dehydrogenase
MTYSGPTDLYIAGTWRPAAASARFTVTDPAAGAVIADVADADVTDARGQKCCGACSRP